MKLFKLTVFAQYACLLSVPALLTLSGCGSASSSHIPESDLAKASVQRALDAWQAGKKPADVASTTPEVGQLRIVDKQWEGGQTLTKYEITGELPADEGPRRIQVKLTLGDGKAPTEATYYVVGKAPDLWIFRDNDYDVMSKQM